MARLNLAGSLQVIIDEINDKSFDYTSLEIEEVGRLARAISKQCTTINKNRRAK